VFMCSGGTIPVLNRRVVVMLTIWCGVTYAAAPMCLLLPGVAVTEGRFALRHLIKQIAPPQPRRRRPVTEAIAQGE
jgi:hypothetical protein